MFLINYRKNENLGGRTGGEEGGENLGGGTAKRTAATVEEKNGNIGGK